MIPEQYWQVIRRWFWLVLLFAILGAVGGLYFIPVALGDTSPYKGTVTLGVARFVSFDGSSVTPGPDAENETLLSTYTTSIADLANAPHFRALLRDAVDGDPRVSGGQLDDRVNVTADTELFSIVVEVESDSPDEAEALSDIVTHLLADQAAAREDRVIDALVAIRKRQMEVMVTRLGTLYDERDKLLQTLDTDTPPEDPQEQARRSGDPSLALISWEIEAVESKLADLARAKEGLTADLLSWDQPLVVSDPLRITPSGDQGLSTRDMLLLGGGAGLVLGWLAANTTDYIRSNGHSARREPDE